MHNESTLLMPKPGETFETHCTQPYAHPAQSPTPLIFRFEPIRLLRNESAEITPKLAVTFVVQRRDKGALFEPGHRKVHRCTVSVASRRVFPVRMPDNAAQSQPHGFPVPLLQVQCCRPNA